MNQRYLSEYAFTSPKWIGVDFDNTIAEKIWPEQGIGALLPGVKEALTALAEDDWKIIIDSARPWADYAPIRNFLDDNDIPYHQIVLGKRMYKLYIGDEAVRFTNWEDNLKEIQQILKK